MKEILCFEGEYRFLSNFYDAEVDYQGDLYPRVENAFQAAKTNDMKLRRRFFDCSAGDAKRRGRSTWMKAAMRPDWDKVRRKIMYELVKQKFEGFFALSAALVATGNAHLEEGNWWGDTFWGTVSGVGENHLGKILMRVRKELR